MSPTEKMIKVILLGDAFVGKTTLRKNFMGEGMQKEYLTTMGADFSVKVIKINGKSFSINIWDVSGQPHFEAIRNRYYRNASFAVLIFDITEIQSFQNLNKWIDEYHRTIDPYSVPMFILGNKIDLLDTRKVENDIIEDYVSDLQTQGAKINPNFTVNYFETSAKYGQNVDIVFETMLLKLSKS